MIFSHWVRLMIDVWIRDFVARMPTCDICEWHQYGVARGWTKGESLRHECKPMRYHYTIEECQRRSDRARNRNLARRGTKYKLKAAA